MNDLDAPIGMTRAEWDDLCAKERIREYQALRYAKLYWDDPESYDTQLEAFAIEVEDCFEMFAARVYRCIDYLQRREHDRRN